MLETRIKSSGKRGRRVEGEIERAGSNFFKKNLEPEVLRKHNFDSVFSATVTTLAVFGVLFLA